MSQPVKFTIIPQYHLILSPYVSIPECGKIALQTFNLFKAGSKLSPYITFCHHALSLFLSALVSSHLCVLHLMFNKVRNLG